MGADLHRPIALKQMALWPLYLALLSVGLPIAEIIFPYFCHQLQQKIAQEAMV